MDGNVVTVERVIPAPADRIFALLADPSQHPLIDGSGTVKKAAGKSTRLALGDEFGMGMKMGVAYETVNTVVEFETDRRIAWQARMKGPLGLIVGGRIWRYELLPVPGGTKVSESWDIRTDMQRPLLKLGGLPAKTARNMAGTLERIEETLR